MSRKPLSEGGSPNLPVIEKPEHQEMYRFYESLGKARTLQKVATQFNKSKSLIQLISRSFSWKQRIQAVETKPIDKVVADTKDQVDDVRIKLIGVVQDVTDTLHELMFISKRIKQGQGYIPHAELGMSVIDPQLQSRANQLFDALKIWGFTWKTPGQFKQLISTLKEISEFNSSGNGQPSTKVRSATQINADKFELHITND